VAHEIKPVRRLVTGVDEQGKSFFTDDSAPTSVRSVPERPGYYAHEVWISTSAPAKINEGDMTGLVKTVAPGNGGAILRVIDFPPESKDPAERERGMRATFAKLYKDADHKPENSPHPGMHETETLDYAIVLSGEIVAVMDKEERLMKTGDILIQRGTNHAWANRSDAPCRICFVLIDGKR
jgi:quercetin dioxygenase-like cupin family protein